MTIKERRKIRKARRRRPTPSKRVPAAEVTTSLVPFSGERECERRRKQLEKAAKLDHLPGC